MTIANKSADEDARTTDIGLFNYAQSYRAAAAHLKQSSLKSTHADAPICFLYYHAIELLLKAFLRLKAHSVSKVKRLGHRADALSRRCQEVGLILEGEDAEVLALMSDGDAVISSRYIRTGAFRRPTVEALDRTVKSISAQVRDALVAAGRRVR